MTLSLRIPSGNFTKYVAKPLLPVRSGLVGEFYFGSKEGDNTINWANPDLPLAPQGALTYSDWAASGLNLISGFYTELPETAEFTVVHVGRTSGETTSMLVGIRNNVTTGITAFVGANVLPACYAWDSSGVSNFISVNDNARPFTLESVTMGRSQGAIGTSETKWIDRWVAGTKISASSTNNNPDTRQLYGTFNWSIGFSPVGAATTNTTVTHRAAAIYDRKLSDAEALEVYNFYKTYYALRGIAL